MEYDDIENDYSGNRDNNILAQKMLSHGFWDENGKFVFAGAVLLAGLSGIFVYCCCFHKRK